MWVPAAHAVPMPDPKPATPPLARTHPRMLWLGAAGLLVALFAAFAAGRISGGYSAGPASRLLGLPDPALERATAQVKALESKLSALELARKVDQASATKRAAVQDELQTRIEEQAQELTFYRSIVSPGDSAAGLKILRAEVLPGARPQNFRLRVVLIQAPKPTTEVEGTLVISVDGVRAGRAVSLPVAASSNGRNELGYAFRSFQEITASFDLPADLRPVRLQIEARSRGAATPLRHSVPWKVEAGPSVPIVE